MILSAIRVNPLPSMLPFLLVILLYHSPPFLCILTLRLRFPYLLLRLQLLLLVLEVSLASLSPFSSFLAPPLFRLPSRTCSLFRFPSRLVSSLLFFCPDIVSFHLVDNQDYPFHGSLFRFFLLYVDVPKCSDVSIACDGR